MRFKRHIGAQRPWHFFPKKWSFVIVEEQWQSILILGKIRQRGRERAEPSNPKRTKGSLGCMISTDRSTHPPSFIRQAGCHATQKYFWRVILPWFERETYHSSCWSVPWSSQIRLAGVWPSGSAANRGWTWNQKNRYPMLLPSSSTRHTCPSYPVCLAQPHHLRITVIGLKD